MDKAPNWTAPSDASAGARQSTLDTIRHDLAQVPKARLIVTILFVIFAILLARYSWGYPSAPRSYEQSQSVWSPPIAVDAERALYDTRVLFGAMRNPVAQDDRIVMIVYTQDTLAATAKRSPLDRTILAKALTNIDAMAPRAIGIDILIDQPQPEDETLLTAMRAMRTPVWLAYATNSTNANDVEVWQQQYMDDWHGKLAGSAVRRASVRTEPDADNVLRNWPTPDLSLPPFLPMAMSGAPRDFTYEGSVKYRAPADLERPVFASLPIDLFADPASATFLADQVRGKLVLVGGDLPDQDRFLTPATLITGQDVPGLANNATMIAQLLDRRLPGQLGGGTLWLLAILVVISGAFTAMLDVRPWVAGLAIAGQIIFYVSTPFFVESIGWDTYGLPAFGWVSGWLLAFAATGMTVRAMGSEQRRFAEGALGKYLPPDIAAQIIRDPAKLSLTGEKRALYTLFTDIEGFTSLSHLLPAERVATLLNAYLDGMSDIVLEHGGTIDKFVGDAVVAFWGAPIARPDDADRALAAALAMIDFTTIFARDGDEDAQKLGRTRVGLHHGYAIVGNFGGEGRLTYTALGDAMNCAARLEGANKYLKTKALVSGEVRDRAIAADVLRPMGRIIVSGRATPVVVWEPALLMTVEERARLALSWSRFDNGDRAALADIEQICLAHPHDAALSAFAVRLREVGPGGAYALREK
ncbi:MAG: adenylate/guanylate cyclase domain-containing protein [Pseudomonadota bacterium]|nr:adenylate/guanylate cyclase domain-containing protein [Pseudomonadota bacterium]